MSAVAITDHGNLYGALAFYHKMRAEKVRPIIGMEAYYTRGSRHEKGRRRSNRGRRRPITLCCWPKI
jgi:DNA polymerase-3 subunit alpha